MNNNILFHKDGTQPDSSFIFVFGSNLQGIHGAGAAKIAFESYGAIRGIGEGLQGRSYAIPTKATPYIPLTLESVKSHIKTFIKFAETSEYDFFITRIGCGFAGFKDYQIAPLFNNEILINNHKTSFPINWKTYLKK